MTMRSVTTKAEPERWREREARGKPNRKALSEARADRGIPRGAAVSWLTGADGETRQPATRPAVSRPQTQSIKGKA